MRELSTIVAELKRLTDSEKQLKNEKEKLRTEVFAHVEENYEDRDDLLPITTISVPLEFWRSTGMTETEFLQSRFPTWDLVHGEYDDFRKTTTFVLRKKPIHMPFQFVDDTYKLSKTSTEPTPEIDWETLQKERADIFEKITTPRTVFDLDAEKLSRAIEEDPEIVSFLTRHTFYPRASQQRVDIKEFE
jgi:hypothetical protein